MATAAPRDHEQHGQGHQAAHNGTAAPSSVATNRWGPYSGAGDFGSNMAVILAALLAALALALALNAAVRYLLRRRRASAAAGDPEKPASVEDTPPPPALEYSAAGTKLAGAAECAICLAEFVDGDAVRVMPSCGHGFHARCIERWLSGGRRSSCPTCRAPAATPQTAGAGGIAAP